MNAEKASTLRLLKQGMGKTVTVLEIRGGDSHHRVRAQLSETGAIPVLFLLSSLAFLEAGAVGQPVGDTPDEYDELDGWSPADFLSQLRLEDGKLAVHLDTVRGRAVHTHLSISSEGELVVETWARGRSSTRWLAYVRGRSHLSEVRPSV